MIIHNKINDNRYILISTNKYGVVTLLVTSNRRPTIDERIEIMKSVGYWMVDDALTIHPLPRREVLVTFGD
jgi:hypothetical protein